MIQLKLVLNILTSYLRRSLGIAGRLTESTKFRRSIAVSVDGFTLLLAIWLSFLLLRIQPFNFLFFGPYFWLTPTALFFGLLIYLTTGQYRALSKYRNITSIYRIATRNCLLITAIIIFGNIFSLQIPLFNFWILFWILLNTLSGIWRFVLRDVLLIYFDKQLDSKKTVVAIYGAGAAGAQLAATLRLGGKYSVECFFDDGRYLWKRHLGGIPIHSPEKLDQIKDKVDQVLLAIPSINKKRRLQIIQSVQKFKVPILQIPSIDDLTTGKATIDTLRPISIEDLLSRQSVVPRKELISSVIENNVICITGGGGSIGSELCRQVIQYCPKKLIIIERNEPSLYSIQQELFGLIQDNIVVKFVLGSATDFNLVKDIFIKENVHIVFHASAYKHVPLVELNPLSGLENNVMSTLNVCRAAKECFVNKVILISTDKAVRPTNVMGASKRLSELVVQSFASQVTDGNVLSKTYFSMVRFGNVLGSSGSVVPLFRKQIADGGPITLTHQDVIRYFMTIPEAAQLVIQASALAKGGEVFLLDMGEPILIKDLAEQMIKLSGLTICNDENKDGDIEIVTTGLRPGEKLFEELLINAESEDTIHPLIFKAKEEYIEPDELFPKIDKLKQYIRARRLHEAISLLKELVPEWETKKY